MGGRVSGRVGRYMDGERMSGWMGGRVSGRVGGYIMTGLYIDEWAGEEKFIKGSNLFAYLILHNYCICTTIHMTLSPCLFPYSCIWTFMSLCLE